MQTSVFEPLDDAVSEVLGKISLSDLVAEAEKHNTAQGFMFYI